MGNSSIRRDAAKGGRGQFEHCSEHDEGDGEMQADLASD
jgi:hypothetical protein